MSNTFKLSRRGEKNFVTNLMATGVKESAKYNRRSSKSDEEISEA